MEDSSVRGIASKCWIQIKNEAHIMQTTVAVGCLCLFVSLALFDVNWSTICHPYANPPAVIEFTGGRTHHCKFHV